MKPPLYRLLAISCVALSANQAYAAGEACDNKDMAAQHYVPSSAMTFNKLDTNHDGVISRKEFNAYNARHFKELDLNHDGKITLEELQGGHTQGADSSAPAPSATTHLDQRFNAADLNHDGGLDRDEAKNMPMLSMYFEEVDANKDGKVTRQEYFDAMPLLHSAKKVDTKQKPEAM